MANLWDVKSMITKVKNTVLQYTETEAKVREATSNDPWGASSTLMKELSAATYKFGEFQEIMTTIWKRMASDSKSGNTWRNIYKSLTLLEYLLKNGSDKVENYANEHSYDIQALTSFKFTDEKQKDQGINVRQRSKEILNLLQHRDILKAEREKASINKNKYIGTGTDTSNGSSSESYGNTQSYNDFPGRSAYSSDGNNGPSYSSNFADQAKFNNQPKYSEQQTRSSYNNFDQSNYTMPQERSQQSSQQQQQKPQAPPPVESLLDFGDEPVAKPPVARKSEDFADFQSAFPIQSNTQNVANTTGMSNDLFSDFTSVTSYPAPAQSANRPMGMMQPMTTSMQPMTTSMQPMTAGNYQMQPTAATRPDNSGVGISNSNKMFSDLVDLSSLTTPKKNPPAAASMNSMK